MADKDTNLHKLYFHVGNGGATVSVTDETYNKGPLVTFKTSHMGCVQTQFTMQADPEILRQLALLFHNAAEDPKFNQSKNSFVEKGYNSSISEKSSPTPHLTLADKRKKLTAAEIELYVKGWQSHIAMQTFVKDNRVYASFYYTGLTEPYLFDTTTGIRLHDDFDRGHYLTENSVRYHLNKLHAALRFTHGLEAEPESFDIDATPYLDRLETALTLAEQDCPTATEKHSQQIVGDNSVGIQVKGDFNIGDLNL